MEPLLMLSFENYTSFIQKGQKTAQMLYVNIVCFECGFF